MDKVPNKYIYSTLDDEFCSFCDSLRQATSVDECFYVHVYSDGTFFDFNTFHEMKEHLWVKSDGKLVLDYKYYDALFSANKKNNNKTSFFVEDVSQDDPETAAFFKEFDIRSMLFMVEKFENYYEVFGFITRFNKSLYSFYDNHRDVFENFILYFREAGRDLIGIGKKNAIKWNNTSKEYSEIVDRLHDNINKSVNNDIVLRSKLNLKKYPLKNSYITKRELQILQFVGQGNSYKEVGNILNLSVRTVEGYMENMKVRLDCTRSQLLKIYHASNFDRVTP